MTSAEDDPAIVALAHGVERTSRRVDALEKLVRQIATDLTTLARALEARTRPPGAPPPAAGDEPPAMRAWLLADDPDQGLIDLVDLAQWMDRVYLQYRDAAVP